MLITASNSRKIRITTTFCLISIFLCQSSYAGDKKTFYMTITTEKKYAYGWTKGRYVTRDGKLIYIPGVPKFETRKTGTEMSLGNIAVTAHGIALKIDLKQIERTDHLLTDTGVKISLMTSNYHTLNGKRYKILGTNQGRVYFKETKGKDIISTALAEKQDDADIKSDE